ncbi:MAG: tyrosine-protein phosphatase [Rhodospirillales bacterium]|nr:tyrosine-protein phosphatase [Rhodospirillales bacterium]
MDASLPRVIALAGVSNLRDLGGWRSADGRRVRFGRLFRSAALSGLPPDAAPALAALGLRHVCDLRGIAEARAAPDPMADLPHATYHALAIEPSVAAAMRAIAAAQGIATAADMRAVMAASYAAYATDWAARYRALFAVLLDDASGPVLFHCSAGKDRTGFAAAMILAALDVPMDQIRADYLATNRLWRPDPMIAEGLDPAIASYMLGVHPELLDAAFAAIDARGGFDAYAAAQLGLTPARRAKLRETLLEAA